MSPPKTLAELAGIESEIGSLKQSVLLMVDCQNTYLSGPMKLAGIDEALEEARRVLERARQTGAPVIHITHDAGPGSLYDVRAESGAIAPQVAPQGNEPTVVKSYPNSFAQTDLHDRLQK